MSEISNIYDRECITQKLVLNLVEKYHSEFQLYVVLTLKINII